MDEARFTMSPVSDAYACVAARQNALAVEVRAKFRNDSAITEAIPRGASRCPVMQRTRGASILYEEYSVQGRLRYDQVGLGKRR